MPVEHVWAVGTQTAGALHWGKFGLPELQGSFQWYQCIWPWEGQGPPCIPWVCFSVKSQLNFSFFFFSCLTLLPEPTSLPSPLACDLTRGNNGGLYLPRKVQAVPILIPGPWGHLIIIISIKCRLILCVSRPCLLCFSPDRLLCLPQTYSQFHRGGIRSGEREQTALDGREAAALSFKVGHHPLPIRSNHLQVWICPGVWAAFYPGPVDSFA